MFETFLKDIQFAVRLLRKTPGFTLVAVLTLALGIGANSVVFSVLNALILRPLNVPQEQSLYGIERASDKAGMESYPNYLDLRDRNRSFDALAIYNITGVALDTGRNPVRSWGVEVSGNYFDALGIQPYLGRVIHSSDEHGPDSAPFMVLTYAYWHTHFRDDHTVVGRVVQLNKHPFTIVGVTPPGFHGLLMIFNPDFFVPIVNQEEVDGVNLLNDRGNRWIMMAEGHLRAGVTPQQAVADLNSVGSGLEKNYPKEDGKMSFVLARPGLYGDYLGPPMRAFMAGLMLLAGLILLAACANLGSLFAARAADRSKEVALRLALGSSRLRILRQVFTEAILISIIGGVVGLLGSVALLRAISAWRPIPRYPIQVPVNPDASVYAVALLLTLASGFLFGAVPVRQILRTDPYEIVKAGSTAAFGRRLALRDLLLGVQVAICAVLVTSSLVAVRGLIRSLHGSFGFEPRNTILVDTDLTMSGYKGDAVPVMQKRMIDALETIPGVESVGLVDQPPLGDGPNDSNVFTDETTDLRQVNAVADSVLMNVSPEYLSAAGTTLLAGRNFSWHDDKQAPRVALVSRLFAKKVFGAETKTLGKFFKLPDGTRIQVVGMVEDGKYNSLTEDPQPAMFLPILQSPATSTWLVLRSSRDPAQLSAAIRRSLRGLDDGLLINIQTWYQQLDGALFPSRAATIALGVMGVMGAMLAITGIFGMAAYSVSRRLKELGIRMAIGAQAKELLQAALGRTIKLLAIGSAAGLLLGILASRVLASIVFSATPRDPLVLGGVVLSMALLGLVASWIPARRALSLNPLVLLREQ